MTGIALVDRNEHEVVEDALGRKMHVDDFRKRLADHGQEDSLAGHPQVVVLHRRHADDGGEVGRALALRDARQMKDGKVVGLRIEARVIAERPLAAPLSRFDIAFEHDVRARRHFEIDRDALDQFDPAPRKKPAQQQFVEPFGHRRRGAVRQHRLGAERDGHVEPPAEALGDPVVLRTALVTLPVHAGGTAVEHLHAIGADIPHPGLGILCEHQRKRDVSPAVLGPAFQDRQRVERPVAVYDLLAGRGPDRLRHQVAQAARHREHLQRVHDAFRHLWRHQLVDFLREIIERLHAEREAHALG